MKRGTGSVEPLKDGRFRARLPGKLRESVGTFDTEGEARAAISNIRATREVKLGPALDGSFRAFGAKVLDLREEDGIRSISGQRLRWRYHLESSDFAKRAVTSIKPVDIADLFRSLRRKTVRGERGGPKLSHGTCIAVMTIVSVVMDEAVERGIRPDNPCHAIRLKRKETRTEDPWDWLRLDEQRAFLACPDIPAWGKLFVQFAWGTGLRQGEQWSLELRDVHIGGDDPHVVVRFGSAGKAPKSGKIRRVPLFGDGLAAMRAWLDLLPSYAPRNPLGLAFPSRRGCRRPLGAPERWDCEGKHQILRRWLDLAMISRTLRWHDLRHTCASSLVSGIWGRAWSLEEVKGMLGHASISTTERYAHMGDGVLKTAARETQASARELPRDDEFSQAEMSKILKVISHLGGATLPLSSSASPKPSSTQLLRELISVLGRSAGCSGEQVIVDEETTKV